MVTRSQQIKAEKEEKKKIVYELTLFNALVRFINKMSRQIKSYYKDTGQILDLNTLNNDLEVILNKNYTTVQSYVYDNEVKDFERQLDVIVSEDDLNDLTKILDSDKNNQVALDAAYILNTMQKKLNAALSDLKDRTLNQAMAEYLLQQKSHAKSVIVNTQVQGAFEGSKSDINNFLVVRYASDKLAKKVWVTQGEDRVRLWHREANGQIVNYNQKYSVGPDQLLYPRDPSGTLANIINCRCSSIHFFSKS